MDWEQERIWKIEQIVKRLADAAGVNYDDLYPQDVPGEVTPDE